MFGQPGHAWASVLARRAKTMFFRVPSRKTGLLGEVPRRVKLLAVAMVRDEARFLPGMLRNVSAQTDGVIALDDGSRDGSGQILESWPDIVEVLRNRPDRPFYDEQEGHRRLVEAAVRHGAEWILAVDADERLERGFRERAERVIRRGNCLGLKAYEVRIRELWNSPRSYRADGIWGLKWAPRLSRALPGHLPDPRALHGAKAPGRGRIFGRFPLADLFIYHLRMLRKEDRASRRSRYESLDPESRYQAGGYAYLTDERGLRLRPVPADRGFES